MMKDGLEMMLWRSSFKTRGAWDPMLVQGLFPLGEFTEMLFLEESRFKGGMEEVLGELTKMMVLIIEW